MTKKASNGRYAKGSFGIDQNLVLLASLLAFVLAYYFGSVNDSSAADRFEMLKHSEIELTDEQISTLDSLSLEDDAIVDFVGKYAYLVDYGSGAMLRGDVNIGDTTISRSISINHLTMFASADYVIDGATVQYTNVSGDKYLFSKHGSVIGDDVQYGKYLEIDGDKKLFIETQYSEEQYRPLSKEFSMTLVQRLNFMSVWARLHLAFMTIGMGILLFVLISLIINNRSNRSKGETLRA